MEVNYQGKTYNLSRNKYKKFRRRCESRKFTPEQNHIWLSKMEETFKGNNLEDNPGIKKISFTNILSLILLSVILLSVLIVLITLIFNPFTLICLIGLLAMTYKMLVK